MQKALLAVKDDKKTDRLEKKCSSSVWRSRMRVRRIKIDESD